MGTIIAYHPDDWIALHVKPSMRQEGDVTRFDFGAVLCPRSLYENRYTEGGRERYAEFLSTGKIPPGCPELKRACSITNIAEEP